MTRFDKRPTDDTEADTASRQGPSGTGKTLAAEVIATDLGTSADGNAVAIETLTLQHEGTLPRKP
jgi:Holliday junction resolvasome RuvABC ATP-dependent DNA helicase subunit